MSSLDLMQKFIEEKRHAANLENGKKRLEMIREADGLVDALRAHKTGKSVVVVEDSAYRQGFDFGTNLLMWG